MNVIQEDIKTVIKLTKKEFGVFEGKTILISGGSGFLGSFIALTLLSLNDKEFKKPCKVIILDSLIIKSNISVFMDRKNDPNLIFIKHDIRKPIPKKIKADYIIHAAGIASPFYYKKFPIETIEVAVNGTKNLLEFARKNKIISMIYFSSSEIYGDPTKEFIPTNEKYCGNVSPIGPRACYDESKRLGETLAITYHELYKVPVKIIRPFNVYGPTMKIDDYRAMSNFLVKGIKNESLVVYNKGDQTRTFCYITDAVNGFLKVLTIGKNGEAYNIGNDREEINMNNLAKMISKLFKPNRKIKNIIKPEAYLADEPKRRCPDLTKAKKELHFKPTINLNNGINRTLEWYKEILKNEK